MILRGLLLVMLLACSAQQEKNAAKINGLCLVAPPYEIIPEYYEPILNVHANWVAVIPYAFCSPSQPEVKYDHHSQWYGETTDGATQAILLAQQAGLKVMLKPHIWVSGQGWAGDLKYTSQEDLTIWLSSYTEYLLHFSRLAEKHKVEMISIGTEVRQIAKSNPAYWKGLIAQIRKVYSGKITYSSNWDNYENISFWSDLDYIGIDAYFPSSLSKTPAVEQLLLDNQEIKSKLEDFSRKNLKKVLFTEFGFKSQDFSTAGHWKTHDNNHNINQQGQANAYQALFEIYWNEDWFEGGFAWKWYYRHSTAGGSTHSEFTPQNKLAEKILKKQYIKGQ